MFVQEDRLLSLFDLPVQLPQTMLSAGGWLAVATVQVPTGATLDLRWMQLYVAALENTDSTDPCGTSGVNAINPNFPGGSLASLFLIKDWAPTTTPWTQTTFDLLVAPSNFDSAPGAVPPVISVRPLATPLSITEAGNYTFVVLNNTTNRNLAITIDGVVTLDTDPLSTT
jgi:hypothetical protein